jgi:hypothetical protein
MQYTQIINKVYLLTKTNSSDFPIADLTMLANNALSRVCSLIIRADGRWQFDDINNTDLPIATTNLVANQQDYSLATSHLEITRVEVKDEDGNWVVLKPIDQKDTEQSLSEFMKSPGTPKFYDKLGNSVFLYPAPSYSQAASLKLFFTRGMSEFTVSDTTKQPGFNILFHDLIPLWVSYEYAIANGLKNANQIMVEIQRKENELLEAYQKRSKDEPLRIGVVYRNPR